MPPSFALSLLPLFAGNPIDAMSNLPDLFGQTAVPSRAQGQTVGCENFAELLGGESHDAAALPKIRPATPQPATAAGQAAALEDPTAPPITYGFPTFVAPQRAAQFAPGDMPTHATTKAATQGLTGTKPAPQDKQPRDEDTAPSSPKNPLTSALDSGAAIVSPIIDLLRTSVVVTDAGQPPAESDTGITLYPASADIGARPDHADAATPIAPVPGANTHVTSPAAQPPVIALSAVTAQAPLSRRGPDTIGTVPSMQQAEHRLPHEMTAVGDATGNSMSQDERPDADLKPVSAASSGASQPTFTHSQQPHVAPAHESRWPAPATSNAPSVAVPHKLGPVAVSRPAQNVPLLPDSLAPASTAELTPPSDERPAAGAPEASQGSSAQAMNTLEQARPAPLPAGPAPTSLPELSPQPSAQRPILPQATDPRRTASMSTGDTALAAGEPAPGNSQASPVTGRSQASPVTGRSQASSAPAESYASTPPNESRTSPVTSKSQASSVPAESQASPVPAELQASANRVFMDFPAISHSPMAADRSQPGDVTNDAADESCNDVATTTTSRPLGTRPFAGLERKTEAGGRTAMEAFQIIDTANHPTDQVVRTATGPLLHGSQPAADGPPLTQQAAHTTADEWPAPGSPQATTSHQPHVTIPKTANVPRRDATATTPARTTPATADLAALAHAASEQDPVLARPAQAAAIVTESENADRPLPVNQLAAALVTRSELIERNGEVRFDLQLDPPELGRIWVRVSQSGDGTLAARVVATRPAALHALEGQLPALRQSLADAGVQLQHFDLSQQNNQQPHYQQAAEAAWRPHISFGQQLSRDAEVPMATATQARPGGINLIV